MELKIKNWSDVTIRKYYDLEGLTEPSEILAVLCECTPEEISDLPYPEYVVLLNKIGWLKEFTFDTEHDPSTIKIGNRKYRVCKDWSKFTTGQYVDFQNFYAKGDLKNYYGYVLATFLIPKRKKLYNRDYDVAEEARYIYDNLDIQRANQLMFFFLRRWQASIAVILSYLKWTLERYQKKGKEIPPELKSKIEEILAIPGLP